MVSLRCSHIFLSAALLAAAVVNSAAGSISGAPFSGVTTDALTVNWGTTYSPGTPYAVVLATADNPGAVVSTGATVNSSYEFGGLPANVPFYAYVSTISESGFVPVGYGVTLASAPLVAGFAVVEYTSATLIWNGGINPPWTMYQYEVSKSSISGVIVSSGMIEETSGWLTGLEEGTTYYGRVRAINEEGVPTDYTNALGAGVTLVHRVMLTPADFSGVTIDALTANWGTGFGPGTLYYLGLTTAPNLGALVANAETTDTSYGFSGLDANTAYYCYVSTTPGSGLVQIGYGVTLASAPLSAEFGTVAYSSAALMWDTGLNPPWTLYQYDVSDSSTSGVIVSSGIIAASAGWVTGLTEGTTYYGRVRAVNSEGVPTAYSYAPGAAVTLVYVYIAPLEILYVGLTTGTVARNGEAGAVCAATGPENAEISYSWSADGGSLPAVNGSSTTVWTAPDATGTYSITCEASVAGQDSVSAGAQVLVNSPPEISALTAEPAIVSTGSASVLHCAASDADGDELAYSWAAVEGSTISGSGASVTWTAPLSTGVYQVSCGVSDGKPGIMALYAAQVLVLSGPEITSLTAAPDTVGGGGEVSVECSALAPDNGEPSYTWSAASGSMNAYVSSAVWTAPDATGTYSVTCEADVPGYPGASRSVLVRVNDGDLLPAAFSGLTAGAITVNWATTFRPGTLYYVGLATAPDPGALVSSASTTAAVFGFAGLDANTAYYGYVSTSPDAGFVMTDLGVTLAVEPSSVAFSGLEYSSAALSWDGGINPAWTTYQYELSVSPGFSVIASSGAGPGPEGWMYDLTDSTVYYGRVRAINNAGVPTAYAYAPGAGRTLSPPSILQPQNNSFTNSLAQVSGTAADDVPVSAVELLIIRLSDNYYWDSSFWAPGQAWLTAAVDGSSWTYDGVPAWATGSSYGVVARSMDNTGKWSLVSSTSVFTYDTAPPALLIAAPGDGSFLNSGSTEAVVAYSDAGGSGPDASTLVIELDSVALSPAAFTRYASSATVQLAGLTQGAHTLDASIQDKAGNPAAAARTGFLVDLSSPVISIVRPANGSVFVLEPSTTAIISYSDAGGAGLDLASLVVKWDGVEVASGAVTVYASSAAVVLADLRETFYTLNASIRDKAGNLANAAQSNFTVDSSFPPAAVTDLAAAPASSGAIKLNWTAPGADGMAGVLDESTFTIQYSTFTGVEWSSMAVSTERIAISTSGVNPGSGQSYTVGGLSVNTSYYFRLWTQDEYGNWSAISNGPAAATFAAAPFSAAFSGVFYSSAALSWQAGANPAWTTYQYELSVSSGFGVIASSGAGTGTTGWLYGLSSGTNYYGRARAVNSTGIPTAYAYTPGTGTTLVPNNSPTVVILQPSNNSFVNSLAEVSGTAADDVAVSSVALSIVRASDNYFWNSAAWAPGPSWLYAGLNGSSWTYAGVPAWVSSSSYTVIAKAKDNAGAWSLAYSTSVFTYDGAPPVLSVALPVSGSFLNSSSTMAVINYSDAGGSGLSTSTLVIKLDAVALSTAAFTRYSSSAAVQLTGLAQAAHTLDASIQDNAGNLTNALQVAFTVDLTPPAVTLVQPVGGAFLNYNSTTVVVNYSDAGGSGLSISTLVIKLDSVALSTAAFTRYVSSAAVQLTGLSQTAHTLDASIQDKAGNLTAAVQTSFIVDLTSPTLTFVQPAGGGFLNNTSTTVVVNYSDAGGVSALTLVIKLDSVALSTAAFTRYVSSAAVQLTGLSQSAHTLDASVQDNAGNLGNAVQTAFTVDLTTPMITIIKPANDSVINYTSTMAVVSYSDTGGAGLDLASLAVKLDGVIVDPGAVTAFTSSAAVQLTGLSPAAHTLAASIQDKAGNLANAAQTGFTVDFTIPPAAADLAAAAASTGAITLGWTAPGDDDLSGALNNSTFTIQYSTFTGVVWSTAAAQLNISTTGVNPGSGQQYTLGGLEVNTSYYFRLWTKDGYANYSALSNAAAAATLAAAPSAVAFSGISYSTAALNWQGGANPGWTTYQYEVSVSSAFGVLTSGGSGSATTVALAGLTEGATYYGRVRALNNEGLPTAYAYTAEAGITLLHLPPTAAILQPEDNSYLTSLTQLSGTAADDIAVSSVAVSLTRLSDNYSWNGAGWTAGRTWLDAEFAASAWTYTGLPAWVTDSSYTVTAKALDDFGLWSVDYSTSLFTYDITPPVSFVTIPPSGQVSAFTYIFGAAEDAGGIAQVQVSVRRKSDDNYWSGGEWVPSETWNLASGTAAWTYTGISNAALLEGTTYVVMSKSYDLAGNVSDPAVNSSTFTYMGTPPTTEILQPGNNSAANSLPQISGAATDDVSVSSVVLTITRFSDGYFWNGSAWAAGQAWLDAAVGGSTWAYTAVPAWVNESSYTVIAKARDNNDHWSADYSTSVFTYDTVAPVLAVTSPSEGAIFNYASTTAVIDYSDAGGGGLDRASLVVKLDGEAISSGAITLYVSSATAQLAGLTQGPHTLDASILDNAGNPANAVQTGFTLDLSSPAIGIVQPANGGFLNYTSTTVFINYSDAGGAGLDLASLVLKLDGEAVAPGAVSVYASSAAVQLTGLSQSVHTLDVSILDNVGNLGNASQVGFTVDLASPAVSIARPSDGAVFNYTSTTAVINYSDAGGSGLNTSALVIKLDSVALSTAAFTRYASSATVQLTGLTQAAHTLDASIRDNAGNLANAAQTAFTLDLATPTVSIVQPAGGGFLNYNSTMVVVNYADAGGSGLSTSTLVIKLDSVALSTAAFTRYTSSAAVQLTGLSQAAHTLDAAIQDKAGNLVNAAQTTFSVDLSSPAVSVVQPVSGGFLNSASTTVVVSYSDTGGAGLSTSTLVIKLDAVALSTASFTRYASSATVQLSGLSQSAHTLDASIQDKAGNLANAAQTGFTVNLTIPPAAVADLAAAAASTGAVTLNWTAPGDDGTSGTLNNSTFTIQYSTFAGAAWSTAAAQINISTTGVNPGAGQHYTLTGLSVNIGYYFRLWTKDGSASYSALSNAAAAATLAAAPLTAAFGEVAHSSAALTWDGGLNPAWTVYQYEVSVSTYTGVVASSGTGPGTTGWVTGLAEGTTYYGRVKAVNQDGVATDYTYISGMALTRVPAADELVPAAFSGVTAGGITVNWGTGFSPGTRYYVGLTTVPYLGTVVSSASTTAAFYAFTGLFANTTYYGYVSTAPATGFIQTGGGLTLAVAPSSAAFAGVFYSSAALSWQGGVNPAWTTYQYELSVSSGFGVLASSGAGIGATGLLTGLAEGATYYGRVRAVNNEGIFTAYTYASGSGVTLLYHDVAAPAAVTDLAAGAVSTGTIALNWTAPGDDGAGGVLNNSTFTIQYSTYTSVVWSTSAAQVNISITDVAPGTSRQYTQEGLAANTSYYFRLWTKDDAGNYSALSNGAAAATLIEPPAGVYFDEVGTATIVASAYAAAFTGLDRGVSGVNVAAGGVYGAWTAGGNSWTTKAPMPTARRLVAAATVGGRLYVIGGHNSGVTVNTNEEYDPVSNTWTTKT
ncbi:MAG: hypothetical protein NTY45_13585, partial [Elusimicrobia bacterium]|nr:hypothetical protein [Elusimicrobiota bacterium]